MNTSNKHWTRTELLELRDELTCDRYWFADEDLVTRVDQIDAELEEINEYDHD